MTQPNPKDPQAELREAIRMELLPKFTDEYIDEWTSDGNDISGLHEIIDAFADELIALFQAHQQQLLSELLGELPEKRHYKYCPRAKDVKAKCSCTLKDRNQAIDQVVSVINRKIGELNG